MLEAFVQGEIRCKSLLGVKGLNINYFFLVENSSFDLFVCLYKNDHLNSRIHHSLYLQRTLTKTVRFTGVPIPLLAAQRYVPIKFFVTFVIIQGFPTNNTSLSVLSSKTLAQVMFGAGLPVVLQSKIRLEPSITVWSLLTVVILGETTEKEN